MIWKLCHNPFSLKYFTEPTVAPSIIFAPFKQYHKENADFSWIRTHIVTVEGEHSDHHGPKIVFLSLFVVHVWRRFTILAKKVGGKFLAPKVTFWTHFSDRIASNIERFVFGYYLHTSSRYVGRYFR